MDKCDLEKQIDNLKTWFEVPLSLRVTSYYDLLLIILDNEHIIQIMSSDQVFRSEE